MRRGYGVIREFRKVDIRVLRSRGKVISILVFGKLWEG